MIFMKTNKETCGVPNTVVSYSSYLKNVEYYIG